MSKEILVEVEHVKAHSTKKDKKEMLQSGSEKVDELAKAGAKLDQVFMAEARAKIVQQERERERGREEVFAALQHAASFHCLLEKWKDCEELEQRPKEQWIFVDKQRKETKHRTNCCGEANKYRCMRCGRGSQYMKMQGKCIRPKNTCQNFGKWRKRHLGGHDKVRRLDRQGEVLIWCRKMNRLCEAKDGTQVDGLLQAGESGHKRIRQDGKTNPDS